MLERLKPKATQYLETARVWWDKACHHGGALADKTDAHILDFSANWRRSPTMRRMSRMVSSEIAARALFVAGAILVGLAAVGFAIMADESSHFFHSLLQRWPYIPLIITPAGFVAILWVARFFPGSGGSGIPQTVAAAHSLPSTDFRPWLSLRIAIGKVFLTIAGLACGASIGREGPTVQVGASLMLMLRPIRMVARVVNRRSLVIAGGAAGIAAAFNAPLAGIMFAIEELSRHKIFRANSLTLIAVISAGLVSLAILGNYSYFGATNVSLPWPSGIGIIAAAALVGGVAGGIFARIMLASARGLPTRYANLRSQNPYRFAALCGLVVALLGILWGSLAFGTGYVETRAAIESNEALPVGSGIIKMMTTWISFLSGIPGGIFAPSLGVGAGLGSDLALLFPDVPRSAVILLVMSAYVAGFTQAPITSFIIVMELSSNNEMLAPLMTSAVIGHLVARQICPTPLYHQLAVMLAPDMAKSSKSMRSALERQRPIS